jgi:prepilin-type N-terminal cleavage/methylation domain-containing protein/prepilin-type processing-associated H-X9-DG protein
MAMHVMRTRKPSSHGRHGFTLIELLVVIAIIALLIGILLPTLGMVRRTARATTSLSNLRQWGIGYLSYTADDRLNHLAWDGYDSLSQHIEANPANPRVWQVDYWWGNAIPPYVGQEPFRRLGRVPLPPRKNIFVDPSSEEPTAPYHSLGGYQPGYGYEISGTFGMAPDGGPLHYFFSYVPNSGLNRLADGNSQADSAPPGAVRENEISSPSATVLMVEKRTTRAELNRTGLFAENNTPANQVGSDPYWDRSLGRSKADWQRFTTRHMGGGHLLFVDGHGERVSYADVITDNQGNLSTARIPGEEVHRMNRPDRIWSPRVAAQP